LQWLKWTSGELVLLDIAMPGTDGSELCRRLRTLPSDQKTPEIYVTSRSDFETRARSVLSGGDDLISDPVLPLDLAVKAVALLLKQHTAAWR
jgi:CheY-like chemotaxis protein